MAFLGLFQLSLKAYLPVIYIFFIKITNYLNYYNISFSYIRKRFFIWWIFMQKLSFLAVPSSMSILAYLSLPKRISERIWALLSVSHRISAHFSESQNISAYQRRSQRISAYLGVFQCISVYLKSINRIYITLMKLYYPIKNKHVSTFNYSVAEELSNRYVFNGVLNVDVV